MQPSRWSNRKTLQTCQLDSRRAVISIRRKTNACKSANRARSQNLSYGLLCTCSPCIACYSANCLLGVRRLHVPVQTFLGTSRLNARLQACKQEVCTCKPHQIRSSFENMNGPSKALSVGAEPENLRALQGWSVEIGLPFGLSVISYSFVFLKCGPEPTRGLCLVVGHCVVVGL